MRFGEERFEQTIAPFFTSAYESTFSLCLDAGEFCAELFETRAEEGFEGNGYDWEALATVFLEELYEGEAQCLEFDSEAGMFCVSSDNEEALVQFALAFRQLCENKAVLADVFSRAELM